MANTVSKSMERHLLEFRIGYRVEHDGWFVGAFIDGELRTTRGPFESKEDAERERKVWKAEIKVKAKATGEFLGEVQ